MKLLFISQRMAETTGEFKHDYFSLNSGLKIDGNGVPIFNTAGVIK